MMFLQAMQTVLTPRILLLVAVGATSGIIIGALPGLTVTMATALLVSVTFGWSMTDALAMIMGVFCGGVYGGSISAVLLNIPGAPAAVATVFDGYPIAKRGEAGYALGLARLASFVGGLLGTLALATCAPVLARFALGFGPFEYLMLILLGLTIIGSVSQGSFLKGMIAGFIGLFISTIGMDPVYGIGRFTFGSVRLMGGVNFIPALIGLFGMSEVFAQLRTGSAGVKPITSFGRVVPRLRDVLKMWGLCIRSALIGTWVGALPGIGGEIAALMAYDSAKRTVRKPSRPFGEGAIEGVIAPEVANNACIGGALIPMLTLGIPGDAVTAVMIGAFMVHGMRPGPLLMQYSAGMFWLIVALSLVANVAFLLIGLIITRYAPRILSIRKEILMPIVMMLCVVGSFALQNSMFDVLIMLACGVLGYVLRSLEFPVGPVVIGIVLGNMADSELRRSIIMSRGDVSGTFLTRPVAVVLFIVLVVQVAAQSSTVRSLFNRCMTRIQSSTARVKGGQG